MIDFESAQAAILGRLKPVTDRGLVVKGLPRQRNQAGVVAPDSVTFFWGGAATSRVGNSLGADDSLDSDGYQVRQYTLILRCRTTTLSGGRGMQDVLRLGDDLLHDWELPGVGRLGFQLWQFEDQPGDDPSYRFQIVFAVLTQE